MRGSHTLEPPRGQTGASDVKHMAYMERLGLWGVGTSFNDDGGGFRNFYTSISEGGVGAMELVSRLTVTHTVARLCRLHKDSCLPAVPARSTTSLFISPHLLDTPHARLAGGA